MSDQVLSKRYTKAFFELVFEERAVKEVAEQLELLNNVILKNPVWLRILDDLKTPSKVKNKMIDQLAETMSLNQNLIKLLRLLASKQRCYLWPDIVTCFKKEILKVEGLVEAFITVADERVWETLKNEIEITVEKISGRRPLLKYEVDPLIIGGLKIRIGDVVYDGSMRGELDRMRENIIDGSHEIFRR